MLAQPYVVGLVGMIGVDDPEGEGEVIRFAVDGDIEPEFLGRCHVGERKGGDVGCGSLGNGTAGTFVLPIPAGVGAHSGNGVGRIRKDRVGGYLYYRFLSCVQFGGEQVVFPFQHFHCSLDTVVVRDQETVAGIGVDVVNGRDGRSNNQCDLFTGFLHTVHTVYGEGHFLGFRCW